MTDEFAINILEQYREKPTLINKIETVEEAAWLDEALDMAIKAIKALGQEPCEDAISRQTVVDAMQNNHRDSGRDINGNYVEGNYNEKLYDVIISLPPVKPQQKIGHWIYDYTSADGHKTYHCSKCGCYLKPKHSEPLNSFKWCSLCGARMIEPQESEKSDS